MVVFAVLQFNDPDPFIWTSIYGGTAIISLINFSKLDKIIYFMFGFIFSICINTIVELHPISEINSFEPIYEFSGLLICIIWLIYIKKVSIIET